MRVLYNVVMYFIGLLSFKVGYVTIPLVYVVIGLALNAIYTLGWIMELLFINGRGNKNKEIKFSRYVFVSYLIFSTLIVFLIPILILIRNLN